MANYRQLRQFLHKKSFDVDIRVLQHPMANQAGVRSLWGQNPLHALLAVEHGHDLTTTDQTMVCTVLEEPWQVSAVWQNGPLGKGVHESFR